MRSPERSTREINKFRDRARTVIKHHFGSAKRVKYLSSGKSNFVFSFSGDDREFIIRVSPDPARINSFIKEQWAVSKVREVGVPAPEILEAGFDLIEFPYMVSRSVRGTEATHHPKRLEILHEMGRLARSINSVRTKGFGQTFDWSENQLSLNRTFKEWLDKEYDYRSKIEMLEKRKLITPDRAKRVKRIFAEAAKTSAKPVLNHSDLRLKNVIADEDGKVTSILDWEGCISTTAPAWELSLALHDLGIDGMQHFLAGYGLSEKKLHETMPLVKAFNITNYSTILDEAATSGNDKLMKEYQIRLSGALDLYSF